MKFISALLTLFFLSTASWADEADKKKILILVSNVTEMGKTEKLDARNNLWEVAPPYHVFLAHGYDVDFASPDGGPVAFMMDPLGISSYTIKYEGFLDKTAATLTPDQVNTADYAAVFIGGGYGPLFDIAQNEAMLKIMQQIYEKGGVVGGCGHGPGAFANVKLSNGSFMVAGRKVAGFPNSTEVTKSWAKQGTLLPFLVEDQLRSNGAVVINKDNIADKHDVVIDQRLVSTMFLPSSALVAKEMVNILDGEAAE